ncbi:uncharacterized protein THITE_2037701 [Thermothielavioides terrestris NRRL 8126]|uniref:Uncharacterized protein n=1 Tax=Thermothielavioides terrestris (strain ATCC 38088 / NRRL 8126) TaxID=578455 RepID=G2QV49_THETT|nr:uncharacterized protein THITE_2037701 [Thermothielavioides terrestris NRRL 8126]AEO62936.1 hypothetical protein THITE_2037701 [Thermothielavioides terrestris NRRL 8126]
MAQKKKKKKKTYSTGDSLVVTDPTTNPAVGSLSRGERTGSRVFYHLWPYVTVTPAHSLEMEPLHNKHLKIPRWHGLQQHLYGRREAGRE